MRKYVLASTALFGLTVGASAADLPRRGAPPVYAPAIPVFTWTGFYVGVNAGYGFGDRNDDRTISTLYVPPGTFAAAGAPFDVATGTITYANPFQINDRRSGFVGGGQIGYNYQFTPGAGFVIGLEADAQYAGLNRDDHNAFGGGYFTAAVPPGVGTPAGFTVVSPFARNGGIDWFGTVRGRLGYAFDRFLVYGTGGLAYGGGSNDRNNPFVSSNNDTTRIGYAAGGGIEYAFTNNLTAKVEGLYVSLDRGSNANSGATVIGYDGAGRVYSVPGAFNNRQRDDNFAVVRAGLNYKFGY